MIRISKIGRTILDSPDLRILAVSTAAIAVFGVVDGSSWKSLFSPTLAYRPAVLFGLTLLFGWRGFLWSQMLFLAAFASFLGWQGAIFITPVYLVSQACGLVAGRKLGGGEAWLSREKSTLAFFAAAALAPIVPALLNHYVLRIVGVVNRPILPSAVDTWLRGLSPMLAIVPAILVFGSGRFKRWVGFSPDAEWGEPITSRNLLELSAEIVLWTLTLWITVEFKARYGLNVTYLTFLPPMALTLFRGMRLATLALAANAIIASSLWIRLHWAATLSASDLRLLVSIYSATILLLAAVVDERKRGRGQVEQLLTQEAVLRESEKHFRTLANSAPVMIWVAGPDKLRTFVNKQWLDFSGTTMEQQMGDGWARGLHPDDAAHHLARFQSAFDARTSYWAECRYRRADGVYRWILDNGMPLYRDGRFAGYIGSCVDISEQKFAAERLRESQAQLAYAHRLAKVGSFELNPESNAMQLSEEVLRILGISHAPPSLTACLRYVHPNDRKKILEIGKRMGSNSAPVEVEYRILRDSGESRTVRSIVEGIKDPHGVLVRVVGACQDITDQVEAWKRLQESEQRLQSAQDLAHVGSWYWDLDTGEFSCSEDCLRIFGQPETERATLATLFQRIAPRDIERVSREIRSSLAAEGVYSTEFQIVRPDGESRTITFTLRVLLNRDGLPRHVFGACQDVTETRRQQEQTFARQKLETLGTLANGIAHDFNNVLGGVVAQAELGLEELHSGARPEEELNSIREVALRGAEIVRELMIYAGTESHDMATLDLSKTVDEILGLLKVSISKRAVLETELAGDLPLVRANSARISQLLLNLVSNASDAIGDRDGVIRVVTRRDTSLRDSVNQNLPAERDSVQLEVSDTGRGMPPETQSRIFEPFFTTKSRGRGLGLSVVEGIVRSLGGTIRLDSEPHKGTTFRIWLPAAEAVSPSAAPAHSGTVDPSLPSRATTVMLVEDEDPLRRAVARMLTKTGLSIIEAGDGTIALDAIRNRGREIDVLVLDITIPGASSLEVFQAARDLRPEVPVIVTSAYTEDVAAASLQGPVRHFLRKPYRPGDLLQSIRQVRPDPL